MNAPTPRTVEQYLDALRSALSGADKALVQDALYDAEEHLRSELAQRPGADEATVLADIVASYGAPDEVADAYRSNEATIQRALRTPPPPVRNSAIGRFFGIYADPRAYLSMLYMLLALVTGIVYFTFAVTGLSLSVGLAVLIIGVPFFLLFVGTTRVLALAEGRLVEAMLGTRMPRRPPYTDRDTPFLARIGAMLRDPRTWGTLVYFLLMLPLGIFYFTFVLVGIIVSVALAVAPVLVLLQYYGVANLGVQMGDGDVHVTHPAMLPLVTILGILLLTISLHLSRGIGQLHGLLAKNLLVRYPGQDA
ncbi:MAG: sensor domain-containing protein [Steroidobacteraceae bacterium]